jgi:hypothetical protein
VNRPASAHPQIARALTNHSAAAATFRERAASIPADRWQTPRAPGKWTPAQEVEHVALAFEAFTGQLAGAPPMRMVVPRVQAALLRWLLLPHVIRTGRLPRARAPREVRPSGASGTRDELLIRFDGAAAALADAALGEAPSRRLGHAYFGAITLVQALGMLAAHTRHHTASIGRTEMELQ